jgi:hypothetical protein
MREQGRGGREEEKGSSEEGVERSDLERGSVESRARKMQQ